MSGSSAVATSCSSQSASETPLAASVDDKSDAPESVSACAIDTSCGCPPAQAIAAATASAPIDGTSTMSPFSVRVSAPPVNGSVSTPRLVSSASMELAAASRMNDGPSSMGNGHSSSVTVSMRPPTRSRASMTTTL